MSLPHLLPHIGLILLPIILLAGCGEHAATPAKHTKKEVAGAHLVETQSLSLAPTASSYTRSGSLRARRVARIYNQEEGRILELPWFEGDAVESGALLLRLDDALLRAELDKAKATARQARLDLKRWKNLVDRNAASKDEFERSRTALDIAAAEQHMLQTRLGYMQINAPFSGLVSARLVEPGDVVGEHTHVLTLVDPSSLVIEVRISELLLPRLAVGDAVGVRIDALDNQSLSGSILRIHPQLDRNTRQGVLEILLEPVPEKARAGQFARVTLKTAATPRLLLPFSALQRDRQGEFVYRVDDQSKARRAPVHSGLRVADRVEILQGLNVGDEVVTRGFLGLSAGKQVQRSGMKNTLPPRPPQANSGS